jgi:DNA repair exonuclease SbcCD ATPase subunit
MNFFTDSERGLLSTCSGTNCVAPFDQKTVNSPNPREDQTGKGEDVLVGRLVGKAGIDFGVAQALARSDAQAAEQLKKLEETLHARISELQKQQKIGNEIPETYVPQLSAFQAELQGFARRMSLVEAAGQQAERFGNHLREEIAALKAELIEQQGKLRQADSVIRAIEAALSAKIEELQNQLGQKLRTADDRGELAELKAIMQTITQRIARVEAAIQLAAAVGAQAAVGNAMGSESGMVQRGEPLTSQPSDNPATMKVESPRNPGEQNNSRDAEKEQLNQLQQRMSAEIERVRAELKEKSGRWKVRKGVTPP